MFGLLKGKPAHLTITQNHYCTHYQLISLNSQVLPYPQIPLQTAWLSLEFGAGADADATAAGASRGPPSSPGTAQSSSWATYWEQPVLPHHPTSARQQVRGRQGTVMTGTNMQPRHTNIASISKLAHKHYWKHSRANTPRYNNNTWENSKINTQ